MIITASELRFDPHAASLEALPHRAFCSIAGIRLELFSDRSDLAACFESYYRDQRGTATSQFDFFVAETTTGYRFSWNGGCYVWDRGELPVDALMFLTDAVAVGALIDSDPALVSMHAAAVEDGGRTAAILGDSMAGKTTTLLACGRAGFRVYSDERAILRDGLLMPFLRSCSVRSEGASLLLRDRAEDALAHHLRVPGRLSLRAAFGTGCDAPPAPLSAIFVIAGYAERARAVPLDPHAALPAIGKWYRAPGHRFDRLASALALLRSLDVYALTLGTPASTAACIRETLHGATDVAY